MPWPPPMHSEARPRRRSWRFMDPNAGEVVLKGAGKFDAFFPKFYAMRYPTWGLASWYVEKYD